MPDSFRVRHFCFVVCLDNTLTFCIFDYQLNRGYNMIPTRKRVSVIADCSQVYRALYMLEDAIAQRGLYQKFKNEHDIGSKIMVYDPCQLSRNKWVECEIIEFHDDRLSVRVLHIKFNQNFGVEYFPDHFKPVEA